METQKPARRFYRRLVGCSNRTAIFIANREYIAIDFRSDDKGSNENVGVVGR
ncbi:MAG: hypothetical protein ACREX0_08950 [Noviherbaspirillum sp.]